MGKKTDLKIKAQDHIMHSVSVALGYWTEQCPDLAGEMTDEQQAEFRAILQHEADRVARLFGFDAAWAS